jgi:hypothetical protein
MLDSHPVQPPALILVQFDTDHYSLVTLNKQMMLKFPAQRSSIGVSELGREKNQHAEKKGPDTNQ